MRRSPLRKRSPQRGKTDYRLAKWCKAVDDRWQGKVFRLSNRALFLDDRIPLERIHHHHIHPVGGHPHLKFEPLNGLPTSWWLHYWIHDNPAAGLAACLAVLSEADRNRLQELRMKRR